MLLATTLNSCILWGKCYFSHPYMVDWGSQWQFVNSQWKFNKQCLYFEWIPPCSCIGIILSWFAASILFPTCLEYLHSKNKCWWFSSFSDRGDKFDIGHIPLESLSFVATLDQRAIHWIKTHFVATLIMELSNNLPRCAKEFII